MNNKTMKINNCWGCDCSDDDLIICDDEMPRMNGDILMDNIRRMEQYKTVPVVAVADRPLGKANAFVSKSDFSREFLIQSLNRMLDNE